jgi:hypothetical protein
MKAQFIFDLPEEKERWGVFNNAEKVHKVLCNYIEILNSTIKNPNSNELEVMYAESNRNLLIDLMAKFEVSPL